ncbi:hypothetical protein JOD57_004853 [Geodermatophilus bullaregiensis]|uniref:hypothetical protein n=1 Tax=Geodermatophilus bullaregiensis TaxID=1564160 RepID=UPI00195E6180|nr:hypothetical protein [Geodermatophilus bullaregiensis]MBM7809016.1 hypothetical protein [Geodermatophilus bullaregiensis]
MDPTAPLRADAVSRAFREELPPLRQAAVLSWLAFATTFGTVRAITYSIRDGRGPFRDVAPGGVHLHHYLWGIALLSAVGGVAVRGEDRTRRHPLVALGYGTGMALVVDEFALLLDLRDVYWQRQGRVSVDVGVGVVALGGTALAAGPVVRRLLRPRPGRSAGPATPPGGPAPAAGSPPGGRTGRGRPPG